MGDLTNAYYSKYNKGHNKHGIDFDSIQIVAFPSFNVSSAQVIGSVLSTVSIPQDCKIQHVSVTAQAVSVAGQPTFNVVSGNSTTIGAVGSPNVANVNGTPVFSAAENVPTTAQTQSVYNASVPDAVCDKSLPLTVHVATAAGDTLTGLQVSLALVPVDPSPASNAQQSPYNNADPSNF